MRMRRRGFLRNSKLLTRNWGYLGGFLSRLTRFRGLFKYTTARACEGEDFYTIEAFSQNRRVARGLFDPLNWVFRTI